VNHALSGDLSYLTIANYDAGGATETSPRLHPGSCSQREPKMRSPNVRGFVCGALGPVLSRERLITQRSPV
jgi:hypothetical protein